MKFRHLFLLGMLLLVATASHGFASTSIVTVSLNHAFQPIRERVGKDFVDLLPNMDGSVDLWYRQPGTTADKRLFGPAANGFVLEARSMDDSTKFFKPSPHPFAWDGYPEKERYPWSAESRLFYVGRGLWLVVSIWYGPNTDMALVQEVLAATAKSAVEIKAFIER